jgi:Mrp family chromosome partitioning ATPase
MSQSDQAFIRAYAEQRQRARTSVPGPASQRTAVPTPPAPDLMQLYGGTVEVVTTFSPIAAPATKTTAPEPYVTAVEPIVPAPHVRFPNKQPSPTREILYEAVTEQPLTRAEMLARQAAARVKNWQVHESHPAPGSEFVTEIEQPSIAGRIAPANKPVPAAEPVVYSTPSTAEPLRAAFEVEQFAWLPLIENLCQQQQIGFDRVLLELQENPASACRILGLTSVHRGEGRTTVAQCLAKRAAEQGLRVCLVDLDDGNPCLAENLGLACDTGLESLLGTRKRTADILVESVSDGVCAALLKHPLAAGEFPKHAKQIQVVLAELAQAFDLVIVDAAPPGDPLGSKQAQAKVSFPAAALGIERWLVVRDLRLTTVADLAKWQRRLADQPVAFLGVLENRADQAQPATLHQG